MANLIQLGALLLLVQTVALVAFGQRWPKGRPFLAVLYTLLNLGLLGFLAGRFWTEPLSALAAVALFTAGFVFGIYRLRDWNIVARLYLPLLCTGGLLYLFYAASFTFFSGLGAVALLATTLLLILEAFALALTVSYAYETLDVLCRQQWRRRFEPVSGSAPAGSAALPMVSIHVPAYSEPPELLMQTLDALARLDYPRYEVLVIDNNTKDPSLWQPVAAYCQKLGPPFRFFHIDPWPGFKAGACNFALTQTDPDAEIIATVDADYVVQPDFLRATVPYFRDPEVAFLQTPQDYREFEGNRYLTDCYNAYKYFFEITMPSRNEYNAIIFGGTMGLIRRRVLEEIGGWDEWCVTEDAESSLRMLQRGYSSVYINRTFGRGLMPFDFDSYKKQRFRWCFGGVQILRKHWRSLVPFARRAPDDRMTGVQRYHYFMGGLQWFNELLTLAFTLLLLLGGIAYVLGGQLIARPLIVPVLLFPLLFMASGILRFLWALKASLHLSLRSAIGAMFSMYSLSWVVAFPCLQGILRSSGVFLRTSKVKGNSTLAQALQSTRWESGLAAASGVIAVLILRSPGTVFGLVLTAFALWEMALYSSAAYNCWAALRNEAVAGRPAIYQRHLDFVTGRLVPELALAGSLGLAGFMVLAGTLYSPGITQELATAAPPGIIGAFPLEVMEQPVVSPIEQAQRIVAEAQGRLEPSSLPAPTVLPTQAAQPTPGQPATLPTQAAQPTPGQPTALPTQATQPTPGQPAALPTQATQPTPGRPADVPTPQGIQPTPARPTDIPTPRAQTAR